MRYKGLTLDRFQEESIESIENNHSVVVSAPTGSGKTLIADYIINKYVKKGIRVIYTAPIKALSNQKYKEFSSDYGIENVGLLTGDIVRNPGAPILIMTTEIYRNMVLVKDPFVDEVSYVIFDEIHYINDIERGYVWEESIIFSRDQVRFLCLSATIPNAKEFADWIQAIKKHQVDVVSHDVRNVPLHRKFFDPELGITTLEKIKELKDIPSYDFVVKGKGRRRPKVRPPSHIDLVRDIKDRLPCFFFCFSRQRCQDNAMALSRTRMFRPDARISQVVRDKLSSTAPEVSELKSTRALRQVLPFGIGFHHAGLLPVLKELVEDLFGQGLIKVLYTTETFAVGINMPAKTACFESLRKYDGISFRFLNSKEYFQIAGRAGRRGIDKEGFAYAMIDRRDFDYNAIKKMTDRDVDPIRSQFRLSVNTVLNLIKQHDEEEIRTILRMNFDAYQRYHKDFDKVRNTETFLTFDNIKKKLEKKHFIGNGVLTGKGKFASHIYADEILTAEIFATPFYLELNEFQILMLLAVLAFEPRERIEFNVKYPSKLLRDLKKKVYEKKELESDARFKYLTRLSALIDPCYHGKSIFEILPNTNLQEGDLIRFFRQILDRLGQVKKATEDQRLRLLLTSVQQIVIDCLRDIDVIAE